MQTASPMTTLGAIKTAQAVLAGKLPLAECLGISVPYIAGYEDSDLATDRDTLLDLVFNPECVMRQEWLPFGLLGSSVPLRTAESEALHARNPLASAKAYEHAAREALKTLVELAESHGTHTSPRLLHRLCVACRAELAELVAEWAALETAQEVG